jgi:hypothetical protein
MEWYRSAGGKPKSLTIAASGGDKPVTCRMRLGLRSIVGSLAAWYWRATNPTRANSRRSLAHYQCPFGHPPDAFASEMGLHSAENKLAAR